MFQKSGMRPLPCGPPLSWGIGLETRPSTLTVACRLDHHSLSMEMSDSGIPAWSRTSHSASWWTSSYAPEMSTKSSDVSSFCFFRRVAASTKERTWNSADRVWMKPACMSSETMP